VKERINLLPEDLRVVEKAPFYILVSALFLAYLAGSYLLHQGKQGDYRSLTAELASLSSEVGALKLSDDKILQVSEQIKIVELKKKNLQRRAELVMPLITERIFWSDILYDISNMVKPGLWLTRLDSSGRVGEGKGVAGVKLNGMALSNDLMYDFMDTIDNSPEFDGAALVYANRDKHGGGDAFSFELTFNFKDR
jgi:Tfp pilus assembly protein PilN